YFQVGRLPENLYPESGGMSMAFAEDKSSPGGLLREVIENRLLCRHGFQASVQPRFVTRRRVLVQDAFVDGLIQFGHGAAKLGSSCGGIAAGDGFAQAAQGAADAGTRRAVTIGAGLSLPGALQRRKMISHFLFVP